MVSDRTSHGLELYGGLVVRDVGVWVPYDGRIVCRYAPGACDSDRWNVWTRGFDIRGGGLLGGRRIAIVAQCSAAPREGANVGPTTMNGK